MPTVTIVIPTMGTTRTKKSTTPEQQRLVWQKMIGTVIRRGTDSAKKAGYSPRVLLVDSSEKRIPSRTISVLAAQAAKNGFLLECIHRPKTGLMEAFITGSRHAIRTNKPDVLVMGIDDYQTESKSLGNLLEPISKNRADFVTGSWGLESLKSFPRGQTVNELTMSRLVTFANSQVKLVETEHGPSFGATVQAAIREGKGIQTYTTFSAMTPEAFRFLDNYITTHFQAVLPKIQMIGLEPLMLATAQAQGLRVENAPIARRFEHSYPVRHGQQVAFLASRRKQFEEGALGVRAVLVSTGQTAKLPVFDALVRQTVNRLTPIASEAQPARFRLPRVWKKGSKKRLTRVLTRKGK